jgi:hypothetical protein
MLPESNDIIPADSTKTAEPPQTHPRVEDAAIVEPAARNEAPTGVFDDRAESASHGTPAAAALGHADASADAGPAEARTGASAVDAAHEDGQGHDEAEAGESEHSENEAPTAA